MHVYSYSCGNLAPAANNRRLAYVFGSSGQSLLAYRVLSDICFFSPSKLSERTAWTGENKERKGNEKGRGKEGRTRRENCASTKVLKSRRHGHEYRINGRRLTYDAHCLQDAQLSQRDRAAGCVIVFAISRRLVLGDNILRTRDTIGLSSTTVI